MKNIWKQTLLSVLVLGSGVLAGCREDEELNLAGYPDVEVGVVIADAENAAEATVKATYAAGTGELQLDGALTRTYIFSLSTPSPKDASFVVEPIISNIPEELVTISETELFIPTGGISASVTVGLVDENTSFMADEITAQTYELGVRLVSADGSQLELAQTEARVKVEKEAYLSTASVVGTDGGNEAIFERGCLDGEIVTEDPISYEFKIVLDKPALNDVTFALSSTGTPEDYKSYESFSESQVTIAAGELESEVVTWGATDDFLEGNDDPATYTVSLAAAVTSDDATVAISEEQSACTMTIVKVFDRLLFLDGAMDPSWTKYDTTGWTTVPESAASVIFDDSTYSYNNDGYFEIDMQSAKDVYGFCIKGYAGWAFYLGDAYAISTSDDGKVWVSQGELNTDDSGTDIQYIGLLKSVNTRYIRFESVKGYYCYVSEFEVYGK